MVVTDLDDDLFACCCWWSLGAPSSSGKWLGCVCPQGIDAPSNGANGVYIAITGKWIGCGMLFAPIIYCLTWFCCSCSVCWYAWCAVIWCYLLINPALDPSVTIGIASSMVVNDNPSIELVSGVFLMALDNDLLACCD